MNRFISVHNHPFPFLLYLEWAMLSLSALTELLPGILEIPRFPWLTIPVIITYTLMGLRLPTGNQTSKVSYTLLAASLAGLAVFLGHIRLFPFLYLSLVIRSCLVFSLPGRLLVTVMSFILFQITLIRRINLIKVLEPLEPNNLQFIVLSFTLLFGLSLIFALLLMNTLLTERQSREQLAIANNQLRQYALRIENLATAQERNRIAREIHDSLGHSLTALNIQLEGALKLWQTNPTKAHSFLSEAKQLGSNSLKEVRQSVTTLRSDPLQGQPLQIGIKNLAEKFHQISGVNTVCNLELDLTQSLPVEVSSAIYRIVQEALTNISKYANASEVQIHLSNNITTLNLNIQDNGKGFNSSQNTTGFGLQGMKERTTTLGGRFSLKTQPGSGCQIQVSIPLAATYSGDPS